MSSPQGWGVTASTASCHYDFMYAIRCYCLLNTTFAAYLAAGCHGLKFDLLNHSAASRCLDSDFP